MDKNSFTYINPIRVFCDSGVSVKDYLSVFKTIEPIVTFFGQEIIDFGTNSWSSNNKSYNGDWYSQNSLQFNNKRLDAGSTVVHISLETPSFTPVFITSKEIGDKDIFYYGMGLGNRGVIISTKINDSQKIKLLAIHEMGHYYGLTQQSCGHCNTPGCIMQPLGPLQNFQKFCKNCLIEIEQQKHFIQNLRIS